jgi:hypothetical protein
MRLGHMEWTVEIDLDDIALRLLKVNGPGIAVVDRTHAAGPFGQDEVAHPA